MLITLVLMVVMALFEAYAQSNFAPKTGIYNYYEYLSRNTYRYIFEENNKISYWINVTKQKSGAYTIDNGDGVSFITMHWDNNTRERFLMLIDDDFLCLYNSDNLPVFFGYYYDVLYWDIRTEANNKLEGLTLSELQNVTASNSLMEGGIDYSPTPQRLGLKINSAWAVRGGVHESLFCEVEWYGGYEEPFLYISPGYVAYSKPYLYKENSRPKKIRIYDFYDKSNFRDYELADTPNFQIIDIGQFARKTRYYSWSTETVAAKIQIEILEIYPGTKYKDTCINSVIYFSYSGQ